MFSTAALAMMVEGEKRQNALKMSIFVTTCLIVIVWFIAVVRSFWV